MDSNLIGYDLETYYDTASGYSLSKMTPEEYIRDERFQVIGASVKVGESNAEWKSARDPDFEDWYRSFPWEDSPAVAHNGAAFDHMVNGLHFGIHPGMLLDTLQIARAKHGSTVGNSLANLSRIYKLGEKGTEVIQANGMRLEDFSDTQLAAYGKYCDKDTELCVALFKKLADEFTFSQFVQGHLFARMASRPQFELDLPLLEKAHAEEQERRADMLATVAEMLGIDPDQMKSLVMSNKKFAALLEIMGIDPPLKISPTTGKPTFAFAKTDKDFTDLLECGSPLVEELVNLRLGAKSTIMETRLKRFAGIARRGKSFPVMLRLHGAHTGRASGAGGKQNLQNLNKRMGAMNPLRMSIRAPEGMMCYAADSSQVEVRTLGDATGETAIIDAFANKIDPYKKFALSLYELTLMEEVEKWQRQIAKSAVLAAGFGQGGRGFMLYCQRNGIDITLEEAQRVVDVYRAAHPQVVRFWNECGKAIRAMITGESITFGAGGRYRTALHGLILPSGRMLHYHDIKYDPETKNYVYKDVEKHRLVTTYGAKVCENLIQADAYDAVMWQAEQIWHETGWEPALQVHDELVYVGPEDAKDEYEGAITKWMKTTPPFFNGIDLDCEFGFGKTYAEV